MRIVPLLVLLACGMPATDPATSSLVAQAPPPPALDVGALVEGEPITLSVSGAPRGATVYFFFARDVGAGPCHPTIPGLCLGVLQPTMTGQATANAAGLASRTVTVPDPLSVATARFQAVVVSGRTGAVSAVVSRVRNDGDLDGYPDPSLPTVGSVTIVGSTACQPFVCTAHDVVDPEGDAVTLRYHWFIDGAEVPGATSDTLPPNAAADRQRVSCAADATDGTTQAGATLYSAQVSSNLLTAVDAPPTVMMVTTSGHVRPGERLTCAWQASDDCTVPVAASPSWTVNGVVVSQGAQLDTAGIAPGAVVQCAVTVDDGLHTATASSPPQSVLPTRWSLEASTPGGRAGYAVAVLGDLNHDGQADVAVGAPDTNTPAATQAGAVYVAYGRDSAVTTDLASLATTAAGFELQGSSGGYDLSTMACTPYLVTACPTVRTVGALGGEDAGPAGAGFGAALGWAGDADGDGVGDLVAAAPYELVGNLWRGRTYVLSGARLASDPLAAAVVDGDGFVFDGECGRRRDLDQSLRMLPAPYRASNGDLAGYRAMAVGDVNGDGLGDMAATSPMHGNNDEGSVYVVYGRADGQPVNAGDLYTRGCGATEVSNPGVADGVAGVAGYGPDAANSASVGSQWGKLLGSAGDFDGDGYDDVLAPTTGFGSTNVTHILRGGRHRTAVRLSVPSADPAQMWGVLLGDWTYRNGVSHGRLAAGFPSGGGGDVNGDGYDDVAFLGRDFDRDTWMNVLFGRAVDADGTLSTDETVDGSGRGFAVPGSINLSSDNGRVAVFGDFNGDGYDDIAASAPGDNTSRGRVYVVFGGSSLAPGVSATSLASGVGGFIVEGAQDYEGLGTELTGGDIDGDGLDDLVLGAPGWDSAAGWDAGRAVVEFGRDTAGLIAKRGGAGPDVLEGTTAGESILGGRGPDLLLSRGGADVLYGGDGDDLIELTDSAFRRVRGGRGDDIVILLPSVGPLDLRTTRSRFEGVERVALAGQTLSLSTLSVLRASDEGNRLVIEGMQGTVATTPGDGWTAQGIVQDRGTFLVLTDGRAELRVSTALNTLIPPTVPDAPRPVAENPGLFDVVATVGAVDPDGDSGALVYALVGDASGALMLDADTGALSVIDPSWFDFEAGHSAWTVTVSVTDEDGLTTTSDLEVELTDVNEAPQFYGGPPVWSVEEGNTDTLGRVTAVDVDAGDLVTYVISDDPSGLFDVNPVNGDVFLLPGATLDHEAGDLHLITVDAVDVGGAVGSTTIELRVGDRDVLERQVRVTFDVRDWSIQGDELAATSAGLESFGLTSLGNNEFCYTVPAADALHTENFATRWNNGWPSAPLSIEAEYSGTICASTSVVYDEGSWNATIPYDITLSLPDEVLPGTSFTLNSTATPVQSDLAMWGKTAGLDFAFQVELSDVDVYLAGCDSIVTHQCAVAFDRRSIYTTHREAWNTPPVPWTAGLLDDPARVVLTVPEAVASDNVDLVIDWDDYWQNIANSMGLPSNEGSFQYQPGGAGSGMIATLDYAMFSSDVVFRAESSTVPSLELVGVDALLGFENGSFARFRLGTPAVINVPRRGDVDGDGDVDVSIDLELVADFTNEFGHVERAGYAITGGFGKVHVTSVAGDVLMNRRYGPVFEQLCAPRVGGQEIPITCFTSGETETFEYAPTGFGRPALIGALDLATP